MIHVVKYLSDVKESKFNPKCDYYKENDSRIQARIA